MELEKNFVGADEQRAAISRMKLAAFIDELASIKEAVGRDIWLSTPQGGAAAGMFGSGAARQVFEKERGALQHTAVKGVSQLAPKVQEARAAAAVKPGLLSRLSSGVRNLGGSIGRLVPAHV